MVPRYGLAIEIISSNLIRGSLNRRSLVQVQLGMPVGRLQYLWRPYAKLEMGQIHKTHHSEIQSPNGSAADEGLINLI